MFKEEKLNLTNEWDKIFPKNENVNHKKVTFHNHFGITLVADMYTPKNAKGKLPAIALAGPYSAVKEQVSGLYAQELASRGFLTIAFDPSFYGESGGYPRYMNCPDINVEDYQAAVDYLSNLQEVDADKIGIIGICGWGGFALQTACIETRIKFCIGITMYDMARVVAKGYNDIQTPEERYKMLVDINNLRTKEYGKDDYFCPGGQPSAYPEDVAQFLKDYAAFYGKGNRGYHPRSLGSNQGFALQTITSLANDKLFEYAGDIKIPVLLVHGENAHSRYFSEDAFKLLKGNNKELYIVPNAVHCDLYDNWDKIPFNKIEAFIRKSI